MTVTYYENQGVVSHDQILSVSLEAFKPTIRSHNFSYYKKKCRIVRYVNLNHVIFFLSGRIEVLYKKKGSTYVYSNQS